jgi:hypothetical protein
MLTFGMPVYGQDGELGKLSGVVIDPQSRKIKELVVAQRGWLDEDARLIAAKYVTMQDPDRLHLNQAKWDFSVSRRFIHMSDRNVGVHPGTTVLLPSTRVRGIDGNVGRLKGFDWDSSRQQLTQLLIKGEWIIGKEWSVPATWADQFSDKEIHLTRTRREIRNHNVQSRPMTPASSQA